MIFLFETTYTFNIFTLHQNRILKDLGPVHQCDGPVRQTTTGPPEGVSYTQDRLTNLALLHIEREFVNQVLAEDMERMINSFGEVKGRRQFFF